MTTDEQIVKNLSTGEMEQRRVARFPKLKLRESMQGHNMPQHVADLIWSRKLLPVIALGEDITSSGNSVAPIRGAGGMTITYAVCPPGTGPGLHKHHRTYETFTVIRGRFEVRWGDSDALAQTIVLEPLDTLSMPPGLNRAFRNVSNEEGVLQVIITGGLHDRKDLEFPKDTAEKIAAAGQQYLDYFKKKVGLAFAE